MRMVWRSLVLFLVFAAPAWGARAEIAFVTPTGISTMRSDGSARHVLVPDDAASRPVWSPDGSRLAYVKDGRIIIDGQAASDPPEHGDDGDPAWSPDGRTVAFSRSFDDPRGDALSQIVLHDTLTGIERVLLEQHLDDHWTAIQAPHFTPDGLAVAYTRDRRDSDEIHVDDVFTLPVLGGMPKLLVRHAYDAVFSPDGARIAYSGIKDHNGIYCDEGEGECWWRPELYVARADGSGARRLTDNEGSDEAPAWAPDGSRILFASDQNLPGGDASEVYSVAPDGRCLTWITNGTPYSTLPSFRPGSGDRFDPGSCNPADHCLRPGFPKPQPFTGGLWLGPRFNGLLISRAHTPDELDYGDCYRFDAKRCPPPVYLRADRTCDLSHWSAWNEVVNLGYTFTRIDGAVLAHHDRVDAGMLFSGAAVTWIDIGIDRTETTLARAKHVVHALRPYATKHPRRLPAPRVPRTLARRLDRTARIVAQVGEPAAAKRLKLSHRTVRAHLRLQDLLRPYRLCAD
jgi:Tol biopolymer transport system component